MTTKRHFWGMPSTDTDTRAVEAALRDRAADAAAGKYAAANFAHEALEGVTRRSAWLLQADVLFLIVVMVMLSRTAEDQSEMFMQFNRWAFGLCLASCLLLLSNLRLSWGSDAGKAYGDPHGAFAFAMGVYKGRAWRYTAAHVFSFAAFALVFISVWPFR